MYTIGPINYGPRNSSATNWRSWFERGLSLSSLLVVFLFIALILRDFHFIYFSSFFIIIISLAIRQCAAWSSTWITHNFLERRKPRKQKETHAPKSTSLPCQPIVVVVDKLNFQFCKLLNTPVYNYLLYSIRTSFFLTYFIHIYGGP